LKAANLFAKLIGPRSRDEEALIRFQREWSHPDLPGKELLEALAYCYGFLQQLLVDGHACLEGSTIKECPFHTPIQRTSSRLPTEMQGGHSGRSAWYRLIDQTVSAFRLQATTMDIKNDSNILINRYGEFKVPPPADSKDIWAKCDYLIKVGQHLLKRDGHLISSFFIEGDGLWMPISYQPHDRADKHAIVREVADFVALNRPEIVTFMAEAWISEYDLDNLPTVRPVNDPNRKEGISVDSLTRTGQMASVVSRFKRTEAGIEFGEISRNEGGEANYFEPIRKAFRKRP
jgi:hypothetical protein